jgi:Serine aminopeptidase, S33
MSNRQGEWTWKALATVSVSVVLVGMVMAQQVEPRQNRGRLRNQGGVPLKKVRPQGGDPLLNARGADARKKTKGVAGIPAVGTYHYTFRLHSFDGSPLASSYYPSRLGSTAPVLILVHESNRSRKDFEEPVEELKGQGLAEHLQAEGYAVLSMDLRGQGQNPRRVLTANDRSLLTADLQAAYFFLLDRHNRGDFNIGKLGVIALGDGANLSVAWANQPGAAASTEGRASDLNALVLVSPYPQGAGYVLSHVLASLAPRVPLALLVGSKDNASKNAVDSVRRLVERGRLNKVESFPSSLHGYKLIRLEPKVTSAITRFLEATVKLRPTEWEPRYNLTPVTVSDILTVQHPATPAVKAEPKKAQAKGPENAKDKNNQPGNPVEPEAKPKQIE